MKNVISGALVAITMASFSAQADEPKVGVVEHCEGTTPVFYDEGPEAFEMAPEARLTQAQAEQYCRIVQEAKTQAPAPALKP